MSNTPTPDAALLDTAAESHTCKGPRKTRLINREAVRELALELAKKRAHRFSRVSEDTLIQANDAVRRFLVDHVSRFPSKGKTL